MRALAAAGALALGLAQNPAVAEAADFSVGVAAFDAGDHAEAWLQFWMLAKDGDSAAQYNVGQFYREGIGIPADLREARRWYEKAAAQGHALAEYALGVMFENGDGGRRDLPAARMWYGRAKEKKVAAAAAALERIEIKLRESPR